MKPSKKESLFSDWHFPEILSEEQKTGLMPHSKSKYKIVYENFMLWKSNNNFHSLTEDVFLTYFKELAIKYKPSTLWSMYSMLKSTVFTTNGVDIKTFLKLTEFLKERAVGYKSQKIKILSPKDVERFLKEAPDRQYLATKVALIFGIAGGCKRVELQGITTRDIEDDGQMLLVRVKNIKNHYRTFPIHSPFYEIVKKYCALRSKKAKNPRFFQNYQKGKCTVQPIGVNKLGSMPKEVARYLGLPDAELYTGHSYRKTSANLRAVTQYKLL